MKSGYLKIKNWLLRTDLELQKKWWHRLLKVIFTIAIIVQIGALATYLAYSYSSIVNQWRITETLPVRLNNIEYSSGVFPIRQLYAENEIIAEGNIYDQNYYFPDLENKESLLPFSSIFLDSAENFCANELDKQIKSIALEKKINLFSPINSNFWGLLSDTDKFVKYIKENDIKCVMIDSYTIEDENGISSKYTFLKPIDTHDYYIYKYTDNFWEFILLAFLSIVGIFLGALITMFIYHKIILYIIYGSKITSETRS